MVAANNSINNTVGASVSGVTNTLTVTNPSNTASSQALTNITVGGGTSGDPFVTYTVSGVTNWSSGIDNSDSDAYVLSASTALGTTNVMRCSTAGEINYPLQPAFLAIQESTVTDATGDGTVYVLGTTVDLTEIFDQNSDFNPTTGVFTAPVTGRYQLSSSVWLLGATAITEIDCRFTSSNRVYRARINAGAAAVITTLASPQTVFLDMDASDTCTFGLYTIDTGGKVDDIFGTPGESWTFFSGYLAC